MDRIKVILAKKYGPLTGLQWLLIAAVVGGILYVLYRRRLEAEQAALETGDTAPFEEGTTGSDFRGSASELPFVGAGAVGGYTDYPPEPYPGLTAEEQTGYFDQIIGGLEELLNPPAEEPPPEEEPPPDSGPPNEPPDHRIPKWQQRIQELRDRNKRATQRIHKLQKGGLTKGERQRVQRIRSRRRNRRRRIQGIRKRHAGRLQ